MRFLPLTMLIPAIFATSRVDAKEIVDRRGQDYPEIVVEAGGRFGTCDQVSFSPDGKWLAAAGDDKVVRLWPYSAKTGLNEDPQQGKTLRWPSWREQRGGVKSFSFSADGKKVAIAGYGMKPANVAIVDCDTGALLALTWPRPSTKSERFGTVKSVAFHPDGRRVAIGTYDGSLWIWDPKEIPEEPKDGRKFTAPMRVAKHAAPPAGMEFNLPRVLFFTDANTLISVGETGEVLEASLQVKMSESPDDPIPQSKKLFNVNDGQMVGYRVKRATVSPDRTMIAAAAAGPQVMVWSIDGKKSLRLDLPADYFPQSLAFSAKGQLAVGVGHAKTVNAGQPRFFIEGDNQVRLYDSPLTDPKPKSVISHTGPAEALAFHPVDDRLVVAGGDSDEITLLNLQEPKSPINQLRGYGRKPWNVAISEKGDVLGIQIQRDAASTDPNARGTGDWYRFDLPQMKPTLDTKAKWYVPLRTADGWSVVPDADNRFAWHVEIQVGENKRRFQLDLDPNRDLSPNCYAFLPAKGNKPTRLIVGHYYGCSLFDLVPQAAFKHPVTGALTMPKSRIFTGHGGEVMAITPSGDGTWFVTAGTDQTVAAWSLRDWPHQSSLGAEFAIKNQDITVMNIAPGSPAWEAGFRVGDIVTMLAVGGKKIFDKKDPAANRGVALKALAIAQPGIEHYFTIVRGAKATEHDIVTTVRQRPMWKWFAAFQQQKRDDNTVVQRLSDWVIWMWNGSYYHTKSAHGDKLVGWHVNGPGTTGTPTFHRLEAYKMFHRPEVLLKLIGTRDVAAALVDALGENPIPPVFSDYEPAPVLLALDKTEIDANGITGKIVVRQRPGNPDLLPERIELWINDHRLEVHAGVGRKEFSKDLKIPMSLFRNGQNQISVMTFNPAGGRADDHRLVDNNNQELPSNLLGLAVGVNDYAQHRLVSTGARAAFGDLQSARNDAVKFTKQIHEFRGPQKFFAQGELELRVDAEANRVKLTEKLKQLAKDAKPNDQLVLFFAGHGDLLLADDPKNTTPFSSQVAKSGLFMICCPDYSPANPANTGVSSDELFDLLAKINCRKLVLLDACHSGQATDGNIIRRLIPNNQGPTIFAACDQGEKSYEDPKIGHGLFTYAILDAMGPMYRKADTNTDGQLTSLELFEYISRRMPDLLKKIDKTEFEQTPICFPLRPTSNVLLKK